MKLFSKKIYAYSLGDNYSFDSKKYEKLNIEDGHIAVFGTTGSGKTNAMIYFIKRDIEAGKSVFYIDPKGEIFLVNSIYEQAMMSNRSKDVVIMNPMWGNISAKLNPLKIGKEYGRPEEITNRVLSSIPKTYGDASFFRDLGYELLQLITKALFLIEKSKGIDNPEICYNDIYRHISKDGLYSIKREIGYKLEKVENEVLDKWLKAESEWFGKVTANISTATSTISLGMIGEVLGQVKYYEKDVLGMLYDNKKIIAGAWFPSLKIAESAAIACKAIFAALQGYISECQLKRVKAGLRIYIDEAKEAFFPGCLKIFTQARSADVFIRFFAQSYEGLESIVGESETSEIIQNVKTIFVMKSGNYDTPNKIMRLLAPTIKQIPSQEAFGEIRTMGVESYPIEVNDILRLDPGQYYCLYKGVLYRGKFQLIKESQVNIIENDSNIIEGKINIPCKVVAFRNWLSDDDYINSHSEQAEKEKKVYELLDYCLDIVLKHQGEYLNDGGMFTSSLIDNLDHWIAINESQFVRAFKNYQSKYDISLEDKGKIKNVIAYYLSIKDLSYKSSEWKHSRYGGYKAIFKYNTVKYESKEEIINVWVIKNISENNTKNEKITIRLINNI